MCLGWRGAPTIPHLLPPPLSQESELLFSFHHSPLQPMDLPVSIEHSEPGDPHLPWLFQEAELIPGPSLKPAFLCPCSLLACSCSLYPGSQPSGFLGGSVVKNLPAMQEMQAWSLGEEDSLEEGNGNPIQYSCLGNPMDRGAWWATAQRIIKGVRHNLATKQHKTMCLFGFLFFPFLN